MKKFNCLAVLAVLGTTLLSTTVFARDLTEAEIRTKCEKKGLSGEELDKCVEEKTNHLKSKEEKTPQPTETQPEEVQPSPTSRFESLNTLKVAQNEEEVPPTDEEPAPTPEG